MLILVPSLLMLLFATTAVSVDDGASARPLRLLTFNLLHDGATSGFFNNGTRLEERLDLVIDDLEALNPDIIALQEASRSRRHGDVPERIARALGFHKVHAPATERVFSAALLDRLIVTLLGFNEGPAILSRFPIVSSQVYDLPRCRSGLDPRILLRADVETPSGRLRVFSTHTRRGDDCQTERVGTIVREQGVPGPSVLMGDFNTGDHSTALTALREQAHFVDAFRAANPDAPGATVWQRIDLDQPTVSRRVDFIFLKSGPAASAFVRTSRVVLNQPEMQRDGTALWPSDHYGVFAEVEWVPRDSQER